MAKLRLGVIGAGSWVMASHLPNFQRHADEIDFVIVNRRTPDLLEGAKQAYGFAKASTDWRDVVAERCDIVVVASPAALHHEHARAALEAGAHVLCEKPFTVDPTEAWDLVETERRVGRRIVIPFGWNHRPMTQAAKRLMEEDGGIGEVEQMTITMASTTRELLANVGTYPFSAPEAAPRPETWVDPRLSGGGYGQAQLSHALGIALWITGLRAAEVFAFMSAPMDAPVELHDAVVMRMSNGAIATMSGGSSHLGANENKHQMAVRIIGSHGQLHLDLHDEKLWRYRGPDDDILAPFGPGDGWVTPLHGVVDTIIALARGEDVPNPSPAELGARTVEALDAAYRSATSGRLEPVRTLGLS